MVHLRLPTLPSSFVLPFPRDPDPSSCAFLRYRNPSPRPRSTSRTDVHPSPPSSPAGRHPDPVLLTNVCHPEKSTFEWDRFKSVLPLNVLPVPTFIVFGILGSNNTLWSSTKCYKEPRVCLFFRSLKTEVHTVLGPDVEKLLQRDKEVENRKEGPHRLDNS